jgi:hypothetical protein
LRAWRHRSRPASRRRRRWQPTQPARSRYPKQVHPSAMTALPAVRSDCVTHAIATVAHVPLGHSHSVPEGTHTQYRRVLTQQRPDSGCWHHGHHGPVCQAPHPNE